MDVGLDRLGDMTELVAELRKARIALLAHPASVDRKLFHATDVLRRLGIVPKTLFGPEHGWAGHAQAMASVEDGGEIVGGARVVSLYGERYDDLSPDKADLEPIDAVIIDLQDVGARFYTAVWSSVLVARACKAMGIRVVVLDRPNPLGDAIEGKLQDGRFLSFVGLEQVPIRHGLTLGQIVAWRARLEGYAKLVTVIPATGVAPADHAPAWDRPFVMPSPNMPTYETALVYPGACLLEGTNLSEGRGTTRPFEIIGAPWLDPLRLAKELRATELPGFFVRPMAFEPMFHKHAGKTCHGVQIHVTDPIRFRPVATFAALIALAHRAHPTDFVFRTEKYEFVDDIPAFDLLTGSAQARERILAGDDPLAIAEAVAEVGPNERARVDDVKGTGR